MEAELRRALQAAAGVRCSDAAQLAQLEAAACTHGLTAKELASRLGAYLLNQGAMGGGALAESTLAAFLGALARQSNKENHGGARRGATPSHKQRADAPREPNGLTDILTRPDQQGPPSTPLAGRTPGAPAATGGGTPPSTPPGTAFKARANKGQVVSTLNPGVPHAAAHEGRVVHPELRGAALPARHHCLMERLEDKVAAVNARIAAWRAALGAALGGAAPRDGGAQPEVAAVGVPVQEESLFVGRVVCEVEGGRLNDTAILLEGDTPGSAGGRAALDLSALPAYRLFPGQTVAVRGVNPSGSRILAKALWSHLPPPPPPPARSAGGGAADAMQLDGGAGPLSAVVAAGPFCLAGDTEYSPLTEMLRELKASPPDMLVLLGPFVDVEAPLIGGGLVDVTFEQLFRDKVVAQLQAWQQSIAAVCRVVLVPAVRDAFQAPTFPQPAIALPADQQLVSLQNPCSFDAAGVRLAGSTTDVLRHLSAVELAKATPGAPADRLAALASHVVGQRRFYPLYPAPPGTCLDLTGDAALALESLPDLLLLPSDLAPFAKALPAAPARADGGGYAPAGSPGAEGAPQVVVINPGRLAKGSSGGTYARVSVAAGAGPLAERTRVDIVRV
ncbi:POLA2 [Scenedesmus sp. PABB004]|nr:POLA2 [Scenedesmus sp. PABB004]